MEGVKLFAHCTEKCQIVIKRFIIKYHVTLWVKHLETLIFMLVNIL